MKQPYNLDREFINWFYHQPYPDAGQNRWGVMSTSRMHIDTVDYWMRQAYKAGAKSMAGETLCILGDWAAGCSGLDPELVCPDEVWDRAEQNLHGYYNQLELFNA